NVLGMSRMLVGCGLLITIAAVAPLLVAASAPRVKTGGGVVEGKTEGPVNVFLGIPYAAPPMGDLRWKPPLPAAKWDGVLTADHFGASCIQAIRDAAAGGRAFGDEFRVKNE